MTVGLDALAEELRTLEGVTTYRTSPSSSLGVLDEDLGLVAIVRDGDVYWTDDMRLLWPIVLTIARHLGQPVGTHVVCPDCTGAGVVEDNAGWHRVVDFCRTCDGWRYVPVTAAREGDDGA